MTEKNPYFENIRGRLGLGCMRLPKAGEDVDGPLVEKLVDRFMQAGFNYFDTAHGYLDGQSETALRSALVRRYPRDSFVLTDKLSTAFFEKREDILPLFESQLAACGTDHFDFYLMHAQSSKTYDKFCACGAYEIAAQLKAEGKTRHVGISFHDTAPFLERILNEQPAVEVVQLQFNYMDSEDPAIQSLACYEVCRRYGKPVIVMEPAKGGSLVKLPEKALEAAQSAGCGPAELALRYAAGFEGVMMVLSGMNDEAMLAENAAFMAEPKPLTAEELAAIGRVREAFRAVGLIGCTGCRYCTAGCPMSIPIPDIFSCVNAWRQHKDWSAAYYYNNVYTMTGGKASSCVGCGQCEDACPQHLPVRQLLAGAAAEFEKK